MWQVVSFYTDDYKNEIDAMVDSAKSVGITPKVIHAEHRGSWQENTKIKPEIILESFKDGLDIVYVDADARFKSYPFLFDSLNCDIAFHRLNNPVNPNELLNGTIFLKCNDKAKKLVEDWIKECKDESDCWSDQPLLDKVIKRTQDLKIEILPVEYCAIFDHPTVKGTQPVILQTQASRRLKVKVNQRS